MIRYILATSKLPTLNNKINYVLATKKYILSQFPYPSGELHLGHARVYYIGDTLARYYKLQSHQVIYPIGFDSFGLPAENAAILHGKDPKAWTENNILQMKKQLDCLNIDFNWDRQLATHTPQYYKWTQLIFIQMLKRGLAYQAQSQVNWDPVDKTVLANEQVDSLGRSWRSGAVVQKKMLTQWFFKITEYAQQLQNNLAHLQWIQRVKSMQQGWIGFEKGHTLKMEITEKQQQNISRLSSKQKAKLSQNTIGVFIRNASDLLNSNCRIRFNRESQKQQPSNTNAQIILGYALNPCTNNKIPILLGNQQNGISSELIVKNEGKLTNPSQKKQQSMPQTLQLVPTSAMRIKDWSISRQRYWGTPIPVIYCQQCGTVPVPQNQLPVILPQFKNVGNPLLLEEFHKCVCPKCKRAAKRETDTMDTFVDSSWYYLRFLDNKNTKQLCEKSKANYWMPVDIYIGGIEHAIMHLLYARFIMRTLSDMGACSIKQPFKELVVQGLVKGKAIRHKETGKYLKPQQASQYKTEDLQQTYQKMSKSKFNGLNPQFLVQKYGPDALRMALFFASPPEHDIDFHQDLLVSADRFLKRVQQTHKVYSINIADHKIWTNGLKQKIKQFSSQNGKKAFKVKQILSKLEEAIEKRYMHVYVANTMELYNQIKQLCRQFEKHPPVLNFAFNNILLPVLSVVAPKTVKQLFHFQKQAQLYALAWPHSSYFANQKQYLIMKGNKLVKKDIIQYTNDEISEEQIRRKLKIDLNAAIKINKKNIVIILK